MQNNINQFDFRFLKFKKLEYLALCENNIDEIPFEKIANKKTLKYIVFSGNKFSNDKLKNYNDIVQKFPAKIIDLTPERKFSDYH